MISILKRVVNQNIVKNSQAVRGLCWIKSNDGVYYSIGLKKETLSLYNKINSVEITRDNIIKFEDELCFVRNENFVDSIFAPFDCKIIERNYNILETINTEPENRNYSWIVRVEPIIWGQSWKIPLDETSENYFNNYRNDKTVDTSLVN